MNNLLILFLNMMIIFLLATFFTLQIDGKLICYIFYDKKSLFLKGKNTDWEELAKDAICFANSAGGKIFIAIEHNIIKK